jgi:hypothetical protein
MAFRQEGLTQLAEAEKKVSAAEMADPAVSAGARGAALLAAAEGVSPTPSAAAPAPAADAESRWRGKLRRQ